MDLLLDTHAIIWFITNDSRLPVPTKKIIENQSNTCFVSLATHWEMSIKHSLGRLELNESLERIFEIIEESGFEILPITSSHILEVSQIPFHHKDPFDRMILGQAKNEGMKIISKDSQFSNYSEDVIWKN